MKIYIQKSQKTIEKKFKGTVLALLYELKINPETVLVTKNGTLVSEKDRLKDVDIIEILQVVSGG